MTAATAETGCVLDGHDGSQLCPPDCWNGTTCFATDPSRWAPPDTTAAHVAQLEAALAAAEARLRAVEALAGEWDVLADYVDDPDSTSDQRARSKAGVIAATQLRAALTPPQPAP